MITTLHKIPSWAERLTFYVMENQFKPYVWGQHDCVLFAMNGIWVTTGVDPIPEYRVSLWKSEAEARAMLEAEGGLITAMDKRFKRRPNTQTFWRGDPVLVYDKDGLPSLALCTGRSCAAPGEEEVLYMPMKDAVIVWAVN